MRKPRHRRAIFLAAVSALGLFNISKSFGALYVELVATSVTGPATIENSSLVRITGPGATIHMDMIAHITGTGPQPDQVVEAAANIYSFTDTSASDNPNPILGDLKATRATDFMGASSSDGVQMDLDGDGDGDLDIGKLDPDKTGRFDAVLLNGNLTGDDIRIGEVDFTVNSVSDLGSVALVTENQYDDNRWYEDGRPVWGGDYHFSTVIVSAVALPEPAFAFIGAVATFASALKRRRG